MITTISNSTPKGVNSGVFAINGGRYCRQLEDVIAVARSKGYALPTRYELNCLDVAIKELISNKIWHRYDICYFFGLGDVRTDDLLLMAGSVDDRRAIFWQFTLLNFVNPRLYECERLATVAAPAKPHLTKNGWVSQQGAAADTNGLNTTWNPTNGPNWVLNDAGYAFFYSKYYSQDISLKTQFPFNKTEGNASVKAIISSTEYRVAINSSGTNVAAEVYTHDGTANGFWQADRTSSATVDLYRHGVSVFSSARTSGGIAGTSVPIRLQLLTAGSNNYSTYPIAFARAGGSLGAAKCLIEHQILTEFRTKLGVQ